MPPTASPVSKADHGAEPHRPDRPEGARNGERGRGAQGGPQDLSRLTHLRRRTSLAERRLQSEIQRHVYTADESM